MDRAQLAHFRALLEQERDAIRRRLSENDHYGLASPLSTTTGELAAYDNHPADLGSEMYEREKDVALLEHDERQLEAIERALARIEAGTYGRCEVCGEPIPLERLEALPTAHTCVECTRDARVSERGRWKRRCWRRPLPEPSTCKTRAWCTTARTRGKTWPATARRSRRTFSATATITTTCT
ncbi:TraR/DksA C4-type zinc finger protein [Calditerricola satsumensis]|uniref:TraR/DksA C4-type zinc finger protein n=1 Tax=Calditerricola satsumensis TaxID=373054 RepID=UPI0009FAB1EC|nr:TraR/DksA C4-type zinc finger protein [Calditerricola satsumensis]